MDEPESPWYGTTVILTEDVKYIGEGPDPKDDPYFMAVMDAYIKGMTGVEKEGDPE